ncbi:hypothetical protein OIU92_21245 [Escherichia coli]|nr:hypothetical protein [Escherichia coli]
MVGVNYYTSSGRGVTGENGKFNFSWGETISFGIDTLNWAQCAAISRPLR